MQNKGTVLQKTVAIIGGRPFFWGVVGVLIFESAWIALTSRYPMAFDEDFHLGIIRLFAHHLSPFWSTQPPGADVYGAVGRDPSYLYQYLMSFPYRLIRVFTNDQNIQVMWLRAINIGLFATGLVLFRQLLLKIGASRAIVHICILFFVLIPVVPLLAAQINYDNLLFLSVGYILLITNNFRESLKSKKPVDVSSLAIILTVCLLASLVKYAFLPIFIGLGIYLIVCAWQTYGSFRNFWQKLIAGMRQVGYKRGLILTAGLVIAIGLFGERYGINIVRYHAPIPDCSKVLSVERCKAYGPWIRDYDFKANKIDEEHNVAVYTGEWFYGMWLRLFFAVSGPGADYQSRGPLPVPAYSAIAFLAVGLGLAIRYSRTLLRRYNSHLLVLLASVSLIYIVALWLDEYMAYIDTGQPVAINGRYLLPVALPVLIWIILAYNELLKNKLQIKVLLASVALVTMLWGGGLATYILRSNDAWYWQSQPVYDANHAVQNILGPVTPGYYTPSEFLR